MPFLARGTGYGYFFLEGWGFTMTKPHSHRGEPLDKEQEAERPPHEPAHIAEVDEPEEQPA